MYSDFSQSEYWDKQGDFLSQHTELNGILNRVEEGVLCFKNYLISLTARITSLCQWLKLHIHTHTHTHTSTHSLWLSKLSKQGKKLFLLFLCSLHNFVTLMTLTWRDGTKGGIIKFKVRYYALFSNLLCLCGKGEMGETLSYLCWHIINGR